MQNLYKENCPKYIAIEAEEELDEDDKEPTLNSEVTIVIKDMGNDNIPVNLLKEVGDSGLKIMTALVNKIEMSGGDRPKVL
jgi:hypothetical protein